MTLLAPIGLAALTSIARAEPAIVYDMGGKFDKSFNEAAYNGAERWKKETGKPYLDFEIANEAQREQAMRRMAERGAEPDHRRRLLAGVEHREDRQGVPEAAASRSSTSVVKLPNVRVDRVQGAGRQLPRRHDGRAGQQDRQGRLRRRHGHPADPALPVRLRAGREVRQPEGRGEREHDRHHAAPRGATRRAAPNWRRRSSPRASTWCSRPPAAPAWASTRPPRTPASSPSASTATRTTCSPARC